MPTYLPGVAKSHCALRHCFQLLNKIKILIYTVLFSSAEIDHLSKCAVLCTYYFLTAVALVTSVKYVTLQSLIVTAIAREGTASSASHLHQLFPGLLACTVS